MRKIKGKSIADNRALNLAHAGRAIPPAVMRRAMTEANGRLQGLAKEKIRLYREAGKYRRKLRQPVDGRYPAVARDVKGLREIGNRLAKRKVIAPALVKPVPGILSGSYSLRLTPVYDYGNLNYFPHNSRNSAFARRRTGELGFNMLAERKGADAFVSISLGAFFIPMFGPAHLRASINPALSFAWWIISTGAEAITLALMDFRISPYKFDGTYDVNVHPTSSGTRDLWFEQIGLDLDFDFGSISDNPMNAAVDVDTDHFYLIQLECLGQAFSFGTDKPGFTGVAGGILNATLPYIDLDLQWIPVAAPTF